MHRNIVGFWAVETPGLEPQQLSRHLFTDPRVRGWGTFCCRHMPIKHFKKRRLWSRQKDKTQIGQNMEALLSKTKSEYTHVRQHRINLLCCRFCWWCCPPTSGHQSFFCFQHPSNWLVPMLSQASCSIPLFICQFGMLRRKTNIKLHLQTLWRRWPQTFTTTSDDVLHVFDQEFSAIVGRFEVCSPAAGAWMGESGAEGNGYASTHSLLQALVGHCVPRVSRKSARRRALSHTISEDWNQVEHIHKIVNMMKKIN